MPLPIQRHRSRSERRMPQILEVIRITRIPNGTGGTREEKTVVASTRCRVAPAGSKPSTSVIAGQLETEVEADVFCPVSTDVQEADRLRIDGASGEAEEYDVVAVIEKTPEHSAHTEILASKR